MKRAVTVPWPPLVSLGALHHGARAPLLLSRLLLRCTKQVGWEEARHLLKGTFRPPTRLTSRGLALGGRPPTAQGLKASAWRASWRDCHTCKTPDHHERAWGRAGGCAGGQAAQPKDPPPSPPVSSPFPAQLALHTHKDEGTLGLCPPAGAEFFTVELSAEAPRRLTTFRVVTNVDSDFELRHQGRDVRWLWRPLETWGLCLIPGPIWPLT